MINPKEWLQERFADDIDDIKSGLAFLRKLLKEGLGKRTNKSVNTTNKEADVGLDERRMEEIKEWILGLKGNVIEEDDFPDFVGHLMVEDLHFVYHELKKASENIDILDFLKNDPKIIQKLSQITAKRQQKVAEGNISEGLHYERDSKLRIINAYIRRYLLKQKVQLKAV